MKILRISLCCSILLGSYVTSEVAYAGGNVNNCQYSQGSACGNGTRIDNNYQYYFPKESSGTWELGKHYNPGDKVVHAGKLYSCIQAHDAHASNWTPPETPSLWRRL